MLFVGLLGGLILATWPSWMITKTGHELHLALCMLRERPDTVETIHFLLELRFDRHCWRRMTFRDPWVLYSPELRGVLHK